MAGERSAEEFLPKLVQLHTLGRFPIEKLVTFYSFADEDGSRGDLSNRTHARDAANDVMGQNGP
jgi:Zn-dependent alcohol dehydrogenase